MSGAREGAGPPGPRLYLLSPRLTSTTSAEFTRQLTPLLAAADIAALLLRFAEPPAVGDKSLAALCRAIQDRDIACLVADDIELALAAGADGVHLADAAGHAAARRRLGRDGIIGVACATRDDAMTAADEGADYIMFGEPDAAPTPATTELARWWSEMMIVPCVVACAADRQSVDEATRTGAEFIAVGDGFWRQAGDRAAALRALSPSSR